MDKDIYIVRHGETDYNKLHIVQGSGVNSSLNETGRMQAKALFDSYKDVPFELVITSALQRTEQTARHFIDLGITHIIDSDIDEICWGIHEGKQGTPELKEDYKVLMTKWRTGDYTARIEEGESAQELATRLGRFVEKLKQRTEKKILVLSHGRSIRCLMCLLSGKEIKHMDVFPHHNTGIYKVVQKEGQFELVAKNNIDHLQDLGK